MVFLLADINWSSLMTSPIFWIFGGGTIIAITAIVAEAITKTAKGRNDGNLKKDMLDRGFSAEEIERVLKA